ncbi:peptide/nickel transport system substrate-binding protein [Devosia enhydra]|uniref:Peptide/nickel transport system substrate-binding protein n=1 Tax=Devosia enhydra TaxID=665118 RepID=A0A1K2I2F9_9HYPH|nr:peptide/nickel transport system substrate-binding protein [Devosia enhydra]
MKQPKVNRLRRMVTFGAAMALLAGTAIGMATPAMAQMEKRFSIPEETSLTPTPGGRINMLIRLDVQTLDPHVTSDTSGFLIVEQIYESLLETTMDGLQPALAESWEISEDGKTYTFKLRQNAKFHSGNPVTSADVKYSIERIQNPATASPRARSYSNITSIETPDDHTVVFNLNAPNAPFLTLLSTYGASIVDRTVIEGTGLNQTTDAGSGAFKLREHVVGQRVVLDKHTEYWREGQPYLDGIDITWNPDDNARAAAIRSGTVDFLWFAAPEFIDALKTDPAVKWFGGSGSLSLHFRMNTSRKPWDDVRVRQAVFYALDRQEILDIANSGHGTVLNAGYLPPDRWGSVKEPIYGAPDIEKAKALLAEAGYPDGFETNLLVISTSAFQVRSAEVEQYQLANVGIKVNLQLAESTVANAAIRANDFDIYQSGFSMTLDPDERFSSAFATGGGLNYGNWSDPEYDALIEKARTELDRDAREKLYQEAETILATRGPVGMTWASASYDVLANKVMGYNGDAGLSFRFYRNLWLQQ